MSREEYKGAIEVSVIFHEGQRMFAVPKQPAQQEPAGSVYRYGKDSSGTPWHGVRWTASGLDLPDGTLIYTSPPAQQEPVAILNHAHGIHTVRSVKLNGLPDGEYNLYTSPPAQRTWVGLTDEEIDELSRTMVKGDKSVNWLCRAIEAAHGTGEKK